MPLPDGRAGTQRAGPSQWYRCMVLLVVLGMGVSHTTGGRSGGISFSAC